MPTKPFVFIICFFACHIVCNAQLPQCSGIGSRYIYAVTENSGGGVGDIWMYNPKIPQSSTNPRKNSIDAGYSSCLAISPNLNSPTSPSPTFYGIDPFTANFQYWDGNNWTNTGHYSGSAFATNIGAGGGFIYSYDALNGEVFRYNGTGSAVQILTIPNFQGDGPYDIVADCHGNFYILKLTTPRWLRQYNSNGTLLKTWSVNGGPTGTWGGGIAIIDNNYYFDFKTSLYVASFSGNTMNISTANASNPLLEAGGDFASCPIVPIGTNSRQPNNNPAYYCENGTPTKIKAIGGAGPVTWKTISGNAIIFGSGDSISVSATTDSKILFQYQDTTLCGNSGFDTIDLIIPRANVDAGLPKTIAGCGIYADSLEATLTGTTPGVFYNASWQPANAVTIPGANKLKPIISPTTNTQFIITVSSSASQGACEWKDSVLVTVEDLREDSADFDFDINYGCKEDTVYFANKTKTVRGPLSFSWYFGDSSTVDTAKSPFHIYKSQDTFDVTLIAHNAHCYDTVVQQLPLHHPIDANFKINNLALCTNIPVQFDSRETIVTKNPPPTYYWDFGDGNSSTDANPSHKYNTPNKFDVTLTVTDFVPCSSKVTKELNNFIQPPFVNIGPADTAICAGEKLSLPLGISVRGSAYKWSTGDTTPGIKVDAAGIFHVELSNDCGLYSDTMTVKLNDCSTWLPKAFSPNADGLNDVYYFKSKYPQDISAFSMSIFNRKGNRVFTSQSIFDGWDGTFNGQPQPMGTYYYMISYKLLGEDQFKKGDITLVR